jgi:hypothetical protein
VKKEGWAGEAPAAICTDCCIRIHMGMVPWGQVKLIHRLRCQSVSQQGEIDLLKRDINRLYRAQEDMEQDMLRSTKQVR